MAYLVSDFGELSGAGTSISGVAQTTAAEVPVDADRCGSSEAAEAITRFAYLLRADLQVASAALAADAAGLDEVIETLVEIDRRLAAEAS